jgi:hypothetical protein
MVIINFDGADPSILGPLLNVAAYNATESPERG